MSGLLAAGPAALAANSPILKPPAVANALIQSVPIDIALDTVAIHRAAFRGVPTTLTDTNSTTFVTHQSVTGRGVLEFLAFTSRDPSALGQALCRVTIDGVLVYSGGTTSGTNAAHAVVGALGRYSATGAADAQFSSYCLAAVPFNTSLLIEYRVTNVAINSVCASRHRLA